MEILAQWIAEVRDRTSYNPRNFFVALRLYERKLNEIQGKYNQLHPQMSKLPKQYGQWSGCECGEPYAPTLAAGNGERESA
ncbi:hypothetical protein EDM57_19635 [Brevibacillus gelatini]|uniref:Uncharacterized protein n=1 Tax=Brevibacillus gelatini TaxID=1655277 RepID=A0A3M8AQQ1_9BACL|nr:hypothetical protein EDM57_19635 [Brevibacillus gelatini]